ncbi:MAG: ribulokinase, partial [Arachnia propionica]
MREAEKYVVGIDFGTLSGRAVVVRISDGEELGSAVHEYRHGVMERTLSAGDDRRLPPDWALQNPHDYIEVLQQAVPQAVAASSVDPADIIGVGTDFTASTVIPVLADGTPLCELPEFEAEPHAYVKLWKHHAAQPQADRIIQLAQERGEKWLSRYGGLVSSEWAFPKALQIFEQAREVYDCMDRLVEAADWIVWQLTGNYTCNAATAGYKDQLQDGSHPSPEYLAALAPGFGDFATTKLSQDVSQLGESAGGLSAQAAAWTGLPEGIAVAVGNIDAHVAAPAAKAIGSGQLLAIMGTSSCQIVNDDQLREVPGMAGVVDGGVVAGKWGYEMGQSGVGDIFAWFVQ